MCQGAPLPSDLDPAAYAGEVWACYKVAGPEEGKAAAIARPSTMWREPAYYAQWVRDELALLAARFPRARKLVLCAEGTPFASWITK